MIRKLEFVAKYGYFTPITRDIEYNLMISSGCIFGVWSRERI